MRTTSCDSCPFPRHSVRPGAINCSSCKDKYYYHPVEHECVQCDEDMARCLERNATTLMTMGVKTGFYRFTAMSWHIYACPHRYNCEGGTVAGQASCVEGAFGALCELCEDGYYLEGDSMRCELCEDAVHGSRVIVLIVMLCTAFVVLVAGAIFSAKHAGAIGKFYDQHKKRIKHTGAKITAFVVAMQIIVLVKENHEDLEGKALPNPYMYFVELLGFLALDVMEFIPMACISGRVTHFAKLMVWTIGPALAAGGLVVAIAVAKTESRKKLVRSILEDYTRHFALLLFLVSLYLLSPH